MEDCPITRGVCGDGTEDQEPEPNICGICFAEEGKAMRGAIDSCDHYFCFVCIMEWAKVESRCPACKRRFEKIIRPGGAFAPERVVRVPARDQANHRHFDPYVDTRCAVCGGMQDECYLLLCDLCDSASHTYCAGLGYTVPSGDWFCCDCSILRREHSSIDEDLNQEDKNPTIRSIKQQVSILDIVREESSNRAAEIPASMSAELREPLVVMDKASGFHDARTVRRRRNVRNHIQLFRENWEALRRGCLYFSPRSERRFDENTAKRRRISTTEHAEANQLSTGSQGIADECAGTSAASQDDYDVDRAWKMMDKARLKQSAHGSTSKTHHTGKSAVRREVGYNHLQSTIPLMRTQDIIQGIRSTAEERRKQIPRPESSALHGNELSAALAGTSKRSDRCQPSMPAKDGRSHFVIPPVNNYSRALAGKCLLRDHQPSSTPSSSVSFTADTPGTSTSSGHRFHGEGMVQKVSISDHSRGKDEAKTAKSEIQSLVKLNLKLLSSRKLETDCFKRIARAATHAILSACGYEDSTKSVEPAIRLAKCPHGPPNSSSSLMPGSCKDCFSEFVRDVVKTTMTRYSQPVPLTIP
ncbi:hypothetical protein MLD38_028020 [Melastoma candidum]|uniref:Uncharacterized protein n=1 Tax=Melastoma candidum TaxID=119954 RepID=A0ACB9N227_9MYRT|nr:hypothetical protein MLD38_028020 [Melastoma candidum]